MFSPFSALTAGVSGGLKDYTEDYPKLLDQMGIAALGRAFQAQQGPIDQMNQRPMAPPPGQPSMPAPNFGGGAPMGGAMPPGGMGGLANLPAGMSRVGQGFDAIQGGIDSGLIDPQGASNNMGSPAQPTPQSSPPQAMPGAMGSPPAMGPPSQQAGGGLDLQSMIRRIQTANPGLPPQAMVVALTHALPMLNQRAKEELIGVRRQMAGLTGGFRQASLEQRQQMLDQRQQRLDQPPAPAMRALKEGYVTTFANGQKWTLQGGKPTRVDDPNSEGAAGDQMPPNARLNQGAPLGAPRRPAYRGAEIPMEEFDRRDNLNPNNAMPPTVEEFKKKFGREPATDSEMEFYFGPNIEDDKANVARETRGR